jgi:hypothetical protein
MHDRAKDRQTDLAALASVPCLPCGSSKGTPIHDTHDDVMCKLSGELAMAIRQEIRRAIGSRL